MSKIKCGILGYGNLGKSLEELLQSNKKFKLVRIFSRRNVKAKYAKVEKVENLYKYENKIDVMFLCGGSSSDIFSQAGECLRYFNTIDAFDTHKKIQEHISACNAKAIFYNKVAFCSFGWDPGLFSLMRVLFSALYSDVYTVWGKGVSQGHSEAIRKIKGVKNAIQYTVPNEDAILKLKGGEKLIDVKLHKRECYVSADEKDYDKIKNKIVNMPNYFKGYKTVVNFVNDEELKKHNKLFHKGEVFTLGNNMNFSVKMDSNPLFTGKILVMYAEVLYNKFKRGEYGAYSILDINMGELIKNANHLL